jgi:hypothetical protein
MGGTSIALVIARGSGEENAMNSHSQPWCLPLFCLLGTTVACSSSAPPPEPQQSAASHLEPGDDDDGTPLPTPGDDDDGNLVPASGDDGAGTSTGDQAAAGSGTCICKVTSNYDSGDFYDSEQACEQGGPGRGQGTDTFQASCDQDGTSIVGYVRDSRMNACLSMEFFLRCTPTQSG